MEDKINNLIKKIASTRIKKGFSYENMATELSITPAAYRKIEIGETKLTVERLFIISDILDISIADLFGINDVFNQTNTESSTGYQQKIENFYQENKDIYEKLMQSKDEQIALLNSLLNK